MAVIPTYSPPRLLHVRMEGTRWVSGGRPKGRFVFRSASSKSAGAVASSKYSRKPRHGAGGRSLAKKHCTLPQPDLYSRDRPPFGNDVMAPGLWREVAIGCPNAAAKSDAGLPIHVGASNKIASCGAGVGATGAGTAVLVAAGGGGGTVGGTVVGGTTVGAATRGVAGGGALVALAARCASPPHADVAMPSAVAHAMSSVFLTAVSPGWRPLYTAPANKSVPRAVQRRFGHSEVPHPHQKEGFAKGWSWFAV